MRRRFRTILWAAACLVFSVAGPAMAQEVDLTALIRETQNLPQKAGKITLVWWIPDEFWTVSLRQRKSTEAQIEAVLKAVRPYMIVAVVDGAVGAFGGVTYQSEDQIRASTRLVDSQGTSYVPRTTDEINADIRNMLVMMKPVLANMLGPLGQNLHFLVFSGKTASGARIANAMEKGSFKVKLDEQEFKWRLPVDALLPGKVCPGCQEACKGSWNFCPWCGTKLVHK